MNKYGEYKFNFSPYLINIWKDQSFLIEEKKG